MADDVATVADNGYWRGKKVRARTGCHGSVRLPGECPDGTGLLDGG